MSAHTWMAYRDPAKERAARRFRHHVRTPSNPRGRIVRPDVCPFCGEQREVEAHHVDYSRPFRIVWCCFDCHRKIDHGGLSPRKRHIYDYGSLVVQRPGGQLPCEPTTEPESWQLERIEASAAAPRQTPTGWACPHCGGALSVEATGND